jgi:hypothetical protein
MKTKTLIALSFLFVLFISLTIYSCQKKDSNELKTSTTSVSTPKSVDDQINFYYQEFLKSHQNTDNIWQKIRAWFIAHTGTHLFDNCMGGSNCGPCPGICFNAKKSTSGIPDADFTHVADNYLLSPAEWDGGGRELELTLFNDTILQVTLIHGDLTANDSLYVPTNLSIGSSAAQVFDMESIIVKAGVYPLTYSQSTNGSTIVDVICTTIKKKK